MFAVSGCQCGGTPVTGDGGTATGGGTGAGGGSTNTGGGNTSTGGGGGGSGSLDGGLNDFCAGGLIPVVVGGVNTCTGDLGKRVFRFAFCSCADVSASNSISVGSIAGARDGGGSMGVNGTFSSSNLSQINGTLWTSAGVSSTNQLKIGRDLVCGGNATVSMGSVGRDARVVGNFVSNNSYSVGGTIHAPAGSLVTNVSGAIVREAVTVAEPCDCTTPVDVKALVQFFKTATDDVARGVSPNALNSTTAVDLTLDCGRYFFQGANAVNGLKIRTKGRVVIAIEGNVTASNQFDIAPLAGSEVDIFISGDLSLSNSVSLGDSTRPAATRVYVGGTQVSSSNLLSVSANLYAPLAHFSASNRVDLQGALFVGSVSASNNFSVKYDDAILRLEGCGNDAGACTSCGGCSNPTPACNAGTCGKCHADSDCCAPLLCDTASGQCVEGIIN